MWYVKYFYLEFYFIIFFLMVIAIYVQALVFVQKINNMTYSNKNCIDCFSFYS